MESGTGMDAGVAETGTPDGGRADTGSGGDAGQTLCCGGVLCGASCTNLSGDVANCGACGHACASDQFCAAGACVTCASVCGGACVDLGSDGANCGARGHACAAGQSCTGGACMACATACQGACVDLGSDGTISVRAATRAHRASPARAARAWPARRSAGERASTSPRTPPTAARAACPARRVSRARAARASASSDGPCLVAGSARAGRERLLRWPGGSRERPRRRRDGDGACRPAVRRRVGERGGCGSEHRSRCEPRGRREPDTQGERRRRFARLLGPPSCQAAGPGVTDCGASNESCCTSPEVPGGTYYRTYANSDGGPTGEADPATVSGFRLDEYQVTVGRFRQFVTRRCLQWRSGLAARRGLRQAHAPERRVGAGDSGSPDGGATRPAGSTSDDATSRRRTTNLVHAGYSTWTPRRAARRICRSTA